MVGKVLEFLVRPEYLEPTSLVVPERLRMVECAGVDPDPRGSDVPRPRDRCGEKGAAESLPDRVRQDTEIGNLDVVCGLTLELEITSRGSAR